MNAKNCQKCGSPLDTGKVGLMCPGCLLREALESGAGDDRGEADIFPRSFGNYELRGEVGRGGMGMVFRARQIALDRIVALKTPVAAAFIDAAARQRFKLEAEAAARLQHPNIVAIHEVGEVDGQPYFTMDLVDGPDLAALCGNRPLPPQLAAEYLRGIASAVAAAHAAGIMHRDLKPSNVLIGSDGRPRVTDFGLAKRADVESSTATLTGQIMGSPSYTPPEQATGRQKIFGPAGDIYGLGALLYHLITGRAPFAGATALDTLRLVIETEPVAPRLLNPALPRDLETICLKCLAKDPTRRYATAAEVAEDLDRFLSQRPIRARAPSVFYQMLKFTRRHRVGVSAVTGVFIALALGLVISLAQYHRAVAQQRATDAARSQAEGLVGLMTHDLTPTLEQRGSLPQLLKTTEAAVRYYETLPPELRNTRTDRAQADALSALGRLRGSSISLHDFKGAEAAMRAALALREKIVRENPNDPDAAVALLEDAALIPFNTASPITEAWLESIIRRGRELQTRFPDNLRVSTSVATILGVKACVAVLLFDKPREAAAAVAECQVMVDQLMAGLKKEKRTDELGYVLINLAEGLTWIGERARAGAVCEQALVYFTEALKADPGNVKLRYFAAQAAHDLANIAPTWNGKRDADRVAGEHYRVLRQLDPDNRYYRDGYIDTQMQEFWYQFHRSSDLEAAPKVFREISALGGPLDDDGFPYPRLWLAAFLAWAGKPDEARQLIEQTPVRFADYWNKWPESSPERRNARVDYLSMKAYVLYCLRDWPAMAGVARDCLTEIEAGLKREPGNGPLHCRQTDARVYLAITAQHEGRNAEAIAQLPPLIEFIRAASPRDYSSPRLTSTLGIAQKALTESYVQQGNLEQARRVAEQLLLVAGIWDPNPTIGHDLGPWALTLVASLCDSAETVHCIGLTDWAKATLTNLAAIGRLPVEGKENLATIARLQAEAAARLSLDALEKTGQDLDAAATSPDASEPFTRAGEATWSLLPVSSVISSPDARAAELITREHYHELMARHPESDGYRFLYAETHRMECYVHFGWDGQVEPARAAFRQYDALLEPLVGRKGYESVRRTRLENSLHLAQLAASVGDRADAARWLEEAGKRFEAYRDRLPEGSPGRGLARVWYLEESAWSAWWLRDWPELARLAQGAQAECDAGVKAQPANEELLERQAMADAFAALALPRTDQSAEAAPRLQAVADRLKTIKGNPGFWVVDNGDPVTWAIEYAWVEALRNRGNVAQARKQSNDFLCAYDWWVPDFPEYWQAQKHLAGICILAASFLDPAGPFEAAKRKELLDQAAAILAPDKVAGRLTLDVQEALQEIAHLRAASAPQ